MSDTDEPKHESKAASGRATPERRRLLFLIGGGVLAVALVVAIVTGIINARDVPAPVEAAPVATVEASTPSPSATQRSSVTAATDGEVLDALRGFVAQRAAAGVVAAQAITSVTCENGVVRVVFDPASAGYDDAEWERAVPFDNLADFVTTPMSFNDDFGPSLRASVTSVETFDASGASLGVRTTAEVVEMNQLG